MKAITIFMILLSSIYTVCYAPSKRNLAAYNYSKVAVDEVKVVLDQELELFLNHLGYKESRNNWKIINKFNCAGKWQLSKVALRDIGYKGTTKQFINDSIIQKECVVKLIKKNKLYLGKYLKYAGKTIHGVKLTLSGMIAASHLGGVGAVQKFINTNYNAIDCNGTTIVKYLKEFQNYDLVI